MSIKQINDVDSGKFTHLVKTCISVPNCLRLTSTSSGLRFEAYQQKSLNSADIRVRTYGEKANRLGSKDTGCERVRNNRSSTNTV